MAAKIKAPIKSSTTCPPGRMVQRFWSADSDLEVRIVTEGSTVTSVSAERFTDDGVEDLGPLPVPAGRSARQIAFDLIDDAR